ncbi:hypothetical protein FC83_GL000845 [Agrilactobacillus composti DSM 18527 = JCM 14202]|uniref:Integral membrane protein n=1 Tax=Agrilactobacillus composti DSM 18527 = JCM 14202 TaxID=1423734 RepID=A0A0R1Y0P8_9LACO|nr:YfhO family protein [Agrilactobacillus composti]KRM35818.1 hypothetical protein FC83_GL000845 [Agrilactobacillus composti DSM 18527 = JCM 14202]
MILQHFKKHYAYYLSFFVPAILILIYFAYRGAYPFGKSSLLTVDLGQQYIDFFAYFKASLLHHPETLIYSFSKAIGGDMLGVSAYYLMSPFNLIFLITPQRLFPVAVYLITVLKFGTAGLTSAIFFKRTNLLKGLLIPTFGINYALMSYLVVNHFNLMWLDSVIMLPIVALSINGIFKGHYPLFWPIALGITILLNYYIGFMIVLFAILYFIFQCSLKITKPKQLLPAIWRFVSGGLLAAGTAAWLLLPTLSALSESKGQHTISKIQWRFEYTPWHQLLKLIIGSFNFDQMSTGYANIFTGSLALFGFILFFTIKRIPLKAKIAAGTISLLLIFSLCYEPLDLLWHGLQFPIWYPYRFSFVISFWLLLLAAYSFRYNVPMGITQIGLTLALTLGLVLLALNVVNRFDFISKPQIAITAGFMLLTLVLLTLRQTRYHGVNNLFIIIVTVEMGLNLFMSLNPISYLNNSDFTTYTQALVKGSDNVKELAKNTPFYRIGKTYERTKNDPMEADYYGASQFNSMMEPKVTDFFGKLGQPKGDGFVTYNNGTLITDALLSVGYFLQDRSDPIDANTATPNLKTSLPVVSSRPDLKEYDTARLLPEQQIYKNPFALPLAFLADAKVRATKSYTDFPLAQQEAIFHETVPQLTTPLYTATNYQVTLDNMRLKKHAAGLDYTKINQKQPAKVTLTFTPATDDPYYMTWGSTLNSKFVSLTINGKAIGLDDGYQNTLVFGVADQQKRQPIKIELVPQKNSLWLDNISIFKFNASLFKVWANTLQDQGLTQQKITPLSISGNIKATNNHQVVMTSIPNTKGWHVFVDGRPTPKIQLLQTLIGIPVKSGTHHIQIVYRAPYLRLGLVISAFSWCMIIGLTVYRRKHMI